jgi:PASTA domain-containing protein
VTEVRGGDSEAPRQSRLRLLAGVAGAVVVLAALGATGGWLLAGSNGDNQGSGGRSPRPSTSPSSSPSSDYTSAPASSAEPSRPESTAPGTDQFSLPDVTGSDFVAARQRLRDLKLGVQLVFGGTGDDRSVEGTVPPPGTAVRGGVTVKLQVRGAPPSLAVPRLVGMTCAAAGKAAADAGFTPQYLPEKVGIAVGQDPEPFAEAHWSDRLRLSCEAGAGTSTPY